MTYLSSTRASVAAVMSALAVCSLPASAAPPAGMGGTTAPSGATAAEAAVEQVQYGRRGYYGPPRGYGPRPYVYGPRYYGGPGPAWAYRPWYRRPYYGTIIAGVALGTIIGVTAYGLAPRPPRADLCWYWADDVQSRGYWDYC